MKKKIFAIIFSFIILSASCAPRYVERPPAPDSLFEAINVQDNKRPKKDKAIMKTLVFSTVAFVLHILTNR